MEQEHFHGYEILSGPGHHGDGDEVHWFNVDRQNAEVLRLEMRVARLYARRQSEFPTTESASELAALLGKRWIHGLIHLGQFERGKTYHLQRGTEWDPLFGEDSVTDDDLRLELLKALQRMQRAQTGTSAILTLDGAGIADVLGVKPARLEGVLGELELEGLVSSESAEFNEPLSQLSVSITGAGLRSLRQAEQAAGQPATLVTVDDVDSFAAVRSVRVEEVADRIDGRRIPANGSETQTIGRISGDVSVFAHLVSHPNFISGRHEAFSSNVDASANLHHRCP